MSQVRLDFPSATISPPNRQGSGTSDYFQARIESIQCSADIVLTQGSSETSNDSPVFCGRLCEM